MGSFFAQPCAAVVQAIAPSLVTIIIRPILQSKMQKDTWLYEALWTTELENNVRVLVQSPLKTALHHLKDALKTNSRQSIDWAYQYAVESITVHEQLDNYWDRFHLKTNILLTYIFIKACRSKIMGQKCIDLKTELQTMYKKSKQEFQVFMDEPDMEEDILWYRTEVAKKESDLLQLQRKQLYLCTNNVTWSDRIQVSGDITTAKRKLLEFQRLRPGRYIRSWIKHMSPIDEDVSDMCTFLITCS